MFRLTIRPYYVMGSGLVALHKILIYDCKHASLFYGYNIKQNFQLLTIRNS